MPLSRAVWLPDLPGAAGVLIDEQLDLLSTSDRAAARVSVFRCSDETLLGRSAVGPHPRARLPLSQVQDVRRAARAVASTDAPIGADGDTSLGDLFASTGPSIEDEVEVLFRGDAVRRAVAKLPDRQRDVISLRFGLVGEGPISFEKIGKQLGITRERVRQIEADALRRLAKDESIADAA